MLHRSVNAVGGLTGSVMANEGRHTKLMPGSHVASCRTQPHVYRAISPRCHHSTSILYQELKICSVSVRNEGLSAESGVLVQSVSAVRVSHVGNLRETREQHGRDVRKYTLP